MKVIAVPSPSGIHPVAHLGAEREITQDLPADIIGECVAEALQNVRKCGIEALSPPFVVMVYFQR